MKLKEVGLDVFIWTFLIVLTLITIGIGHSFGMKDSLVNVFILIIAFVKTRLIIMHFMEVKKVPFPLRIVFEVWGVMICSILIFLLKF